MNAILGPGNNLVKWMEVAETDATKRDSEQEQIPEFGAGKTEAAADLEAIMLNLSLIQI